MNPPPILSATAAPDALADDRATLAFTLLIAALLSAFVISFAEAPPHLIFSEPLSHMQPNGPTGPVSGRLE